MSQVLTTVRNGRLTLRDDGNDKVESIAYAQAIRGARSGRRASDKSNREGGPGRMGRATTTHDDVTSKYNKNDDDEMESDTIEIDPGGHESDAEDEMYNHAAMCSDKAALSGCSP
jgi:hypothetical protein